MFAKQIGRNVKVYIDDMLTKSVTIDKHVSDLWKTFDVLTRYGMKLNPAKCVFYVPSSKFLGYQVYQRSIEVNPDKIRALADMVSLKNLKDVQKLTGCLASLNRFISKSTDKCLPFFRALKKGKGIKWNKDCKQAFQALKDDLSWAPLLLKPVHGETLYLYLSVTEVATSLVLVREFNIKYLPRTAIKGQAIIDFVTEFTEPNVEVVRMMVEQSKKNFQWQLHVDGSSNTHGSGAGIIVSTPEGDSVECALHFDFKATNNQVEYEALIAGLRVCTALGTNEIEIFSDSQDRTNPREKNEQADALAKLASATVNIWPSTVPMAHLPQPSITEQTKVGTNGKTEAVNKIIKHNLKAKLAVKKGNWAEKLPQVLWAYRTTERNSTGETPYSMAFGAEAIIPVETTFSSPRGMEHIALLEWEPASFLNHAMRNI
ncbi:hypothetical protein QYF36_003725 [Acer negundo]|nr:hypothetical protein QYF36_003725 [Acer negundo]